MTRIQKIGLLVAVIAAFVVIVLYPTFALPVFGLAGILALGYWLNKKYPRVRSGRKSTFKWLNKKIGPAGQRFKNWLGGFHWPTIANPRGIGPVESIIITSFLAVLTSVIVGTIATYVAIKSGGFDAYSWLAWSFWFLLTVGGALLLLADERTRGPMQPTIEEDGAVLIEGTTRMLPVPQNLNAIILWLKARRKSFFYLEGGAMIPWWLGFSVSTAPVSQTKVQFHDENGRAQPEQNRGYFRKQEAQGYVFIGRRTIQEVVQVQSLDLVKVTADANSIISVTNPVAWQGGDNPYGTVIGQLEASLRIAISNFNAEDSNAVRSLYPSLLMGEHMLLIKAQEVKGDFLEGDLIRSKSGGRIVYKASKLKADGTPYTKDINKFLADANLKADDDCKPTGGFTKDMIEVLSVSEEYHNLLKSYGSIKEGAAIKDVSLPAKVEEAASKILVERRERIADLYEAETANQAAEVIKAAIDTHGIEAVRMMLIERSKGTLVIGEGNNPVAQFAAAMQKGTNP